MCLSIIIKNYPLNNKIIQPAVPAGSVRENGWLTKISKTGSIGKLQRVGVIIDCPLSAFIIRR